MAQLILVVDDNEDARELLKLTFEHAGYEVVTASGGEDGLKEARRRRPDLVLTDLNMPTMSGDEMAAALKRIPAMKGVPVVAVTGSGFYENKGLFTMVVLKPLEPRDAVRLVRSLLGE